MARARRLHRLPVNPMAEIEKPRHRRSTAIEVFSPEEVLAFVRIADSEQDAAIYLTAAFTGLRCGELTTPRSGKVRSVPLAPLVAEALARPGQREYFTGEDDLVFPGLVGGYLDASALSRRYRAALKRAELRPLRFHDLRHTFGTRMIAKADIRRVQEWMGHAEVAAYDEVPPLRRAPGRSAPGRRSLRHRSPGTRKPPRRAVFFSYRQRGSGPLAPSCVLAR